ncbi:MAG TPA: DinB family protein [Bacteroidia bacterium]|jgi:hypothetical protein|nr:DinB family protein [Bacteroidia bacterium]
MEKERFLTEEYIPLLGKLKADTKPQWGVLSAQGMVEHMTDSFGIAWERLKEPMQTPPEWLEKAKSFAMSDKPFKPNTKNTYMSETPAPLRHANMQAAIKELETEIADFVQYFKQRPGKIVTNPFFGDLNYTEWVHLLHKHSLHHLKQFSLVN